MTSYQDVLNFWFKESKPSQWFKKDAAFDDAIRSRFLSTYEAATKGETVAWRSTPEGRVAEIIVLDQFSRNMFRGTAQAFAADQQALALAQEAVALGLDKKLSRDERHFLYMPYMHSESREVHKKAFWLFLLSFDWGGFKYERMHKKIIDRFGRYPHRNESLGRPSTPEEIEFIKTHPGF